MPPQPELGLVGTRRLARFEHRAQHLQQALAGQFRDRVTGGPAQHLTPAEELAELVVGELHDEVLTGQVGHRGQQVVEHLTQARQFPATPAP